MKIWVFGFISTILFCLGIISCAGCQKKNPPLSKTYAKPDKPEVTAKVSKGPLSFEMIPGHSKVLAAKSNQIYLLLRLSGNTAENSSRPPLNLGVVVDRSGSMSGEKISAVKVAALELVKRLNKNDKVTLVSYSSDVEIHQQGVPVNSEWLPVLKSHILGIQSGGMTALGPALLDTLTLLEGDKTEQDRLSHVILLSDGLANVGVTSPEILGRKTSDSFENGISVSTLGVGLDYNEDLMTHLADQGGGQYHFVQDTQNIANVLNDELKGLESTVARNIELEIPNIKGVKLLKSFGYPNRIEKDKTVVKVGSIRSGQNRDILLQFQIDPVTEPILPLGVFNLRFKDTTSKNPSFLSMTNQVNVAVTDNPAEMAASENTEVVVLAAEMKSAEKLEGAARAVENGDFASAQKILNDSIDMLHKQAEKTPDTKLEQQIQTMQTAREDLDQAKKSFSNRKEYIKNKKAKSYIQQKQSYKQKTVKHIQNKNSLKH